jgi:hypothetical protein
MIENATVSIYAPIKAPNDEGTLIDTWGYKQAPVIAPVETFRADVQPHVLSVVEQQVYGITNQSADTKIMFADYSANADIPNRAQVVSDMDGKTKYYNVRAINVWQIHAEYLLVPVVGE